MSSARSATYVAITCAVVASAASGPLDKWSVSSRCAAAMGILSRLAWPSSEILRRLVGTGKAWTSCAAPVRTKIEPSGAIDGPEPLCPKPPPEPVTVEHQIAAN